MPVIDDEAVCLRQWDWSETSQTVSLFTRTAGLIRCVAKGSKRSGAGATFSGGVELLSRAGVRIHTKPNRDLSILAEWDLLEVFPALRRALPDHHAGLFMADCVLHFAADHDPHPRTYDALVTGLRALGPGAPLSLTLARFQWHLLHDAGLKPDLAGLATQRGTVLRFDPHAGTLTDALPRAASPAPSSAAMTQQATQDWRVRRATVELLAALEAERSAGVPPPAAAVGHAARAAAFLAAYVRWVLGTQPRTLAHVFPDLAGVSLQGPGERQNRDRPARR